MAISQKETLLAIQISQYIQDYFDNNKIYNTVKTSEIYEVLYKKGIENWDKNSASKFREFLKKLASNSALDLIPQCRPEMSGKSMTWYFESTPGKTIKARKLVPLNKPVES
ncbi:MAG TPA: hypothetical protein VIK89_09845 [Cytophagaceae bacterium]